MKQNKFEEFHPIFYPESVAVMGVSGNGVNAGARYYLSLLRAGFLGETYAVNPRGGELEGRPIYTSLASIPGKVDHVIIAVPAGALLQALDDCASKGVKVAEIYTAGFSETGTEEGRRAEKALVEKARQLGILIVGPNCIGVYSPARRLPYGMSNYSGEAGTIGFVSQSGGLCGMMMDLGMTKGLKFSKAVSFGNGSLLDSVDFLDYFAADPETKIVGAYLEGMRQGPRFLSLARRLTKEKPFVVWIGGRTEVGARSAASHTGSLAAPDALWSAALKQAGAVRVYSMEELVDTLQAFQQIESPAGENMAFVTGLTGGGGGVGVSASDALMGIGLRLPAFGAETRRKLQQMLPAVGTFIHNPLDMGGQTIAMDSFLQCLLAVAADPSVDTIVFHERTGFFYQPFYAGKLAPVNEVLIKFKQMQPKPVVVVSPGGTMEKERIELEKPLVQAGIPVFPTSERAAQAMKNHHDYWASRQEAAP